ncbi:MAG: Protein Jag [Thermoanaerobacterales bacterium 50_218]|nr:MAG: Protein Jag [Thermoanaerobacterales bacterium 50_218]HAA89704.1 protein jag [Peptococcaceae bacterium]
MKWIEAEGNTVDEAVSLALQKLGVDRSRVDVEVLDPGSRGFLGILRSRQARVRVSVRETPETVIREFLETLLKEMGMEADLEITSHGEYWSAAFSGPDVRFLIGRRGDTLNALQLLVNLVVNKKLTEKVRIILDAEGYRQRREETLRRLARRLSEKVRKTKKDIALEPMTPQERRVIHMELQEDPWVYTVSKGEEPHRKVVICLKR